MEILGLLLVIVLGGCVYVFFKNKEDKKDVQENVVTPENVAPIATGSISLSPPPYPALNATEAVALTIAKVAETSIDIETPVVAAVAEEPPAPKVPAKRGPTAKSTTTKTKKKK